MNKYWYSFDDQMRELFGGKVYRLSLFAGKTCPNRDGTLSDRGCIFCSAGGSGDFAEPLCGSIDMQIERAMERVSRKIGKNTKFAGYMAYFQPFTNTYGDIDELSGIFKRAAARDDILSLSIATRPDCLPDEMIGILSDINLKKPVFVELGLQTVHEDTAAYINRCYETGVFEDAFYRLKAAGLKVTAHVIIGLPGENAARTAETVKYLAALTADKSSCPQGTYEHIDGVKLQLLHVLKGTPLSGLLPADAAEYTDGRDIILRDGMILPQYTPEQYAELIYRLVRLLPERTAVHRLTGDGPKKLLILPQWTADKKRVLNTITAVFRKNG